MKRREWYIPPESHSFYISGGQPSGPQINSNAGNEPWPWFVAEKPENTAIGTAFSLGVTSRQPRVSSDKEGSNSDVVGVTIWHATMSTVLPYQYVSYEECSHALR